MKTQRAGIFNLLQKHLDRHIELYGHSPRVIYLSRRLMKRYKAKFTGPDYFVGKKRLYAFFGVPVIEMPQNGIGMF